MPDPISWQDAIADFMAGIHASRAIKTEKFYRTHLNQLLAYAQEHDIALPDFKGRHLRAFMARRADEVAERTRLHDCRCASVFFRFCLREGYTTVNPLADYSIPKPPKPLVKCPTPAQLDALLRAIERRWDPRENRKIRFMAKEVRHFLRVRDYAIVSLLIETGCRLGEALSLVLSDLDREACRITFTKTKSKDNRTVPITSALLTAMQPWLILRERIERDARGDEARGQERRCGATLFITQTGGAVDVSAFGKSFRGYLDFAGIERFTRHAIRHFTLTQLAGRNILSTQAIAGHKSLATTQGYLHSNEEIVRSDHAEVAPLGKILQNKRTVQQKRKRKII